MCWSELLKMIYNRTKYFPVIAIFPSASLFSKNSYRFTPRFLFSRLVLVLRMMLQAYEPL